MVLDDDGTWSSPAPECVGRSRATGNIPVGYYKDPKKTAETFMTAPNGARYAMPGDYAAVDADGTVTMLGRGSVSINSGGEKIYPEEVEAGAQGATPTSSTRWWSACPTSASASASPPSCSRGRARRPTLDELEAHCRKHIAGYKVPRAAHPGGREIERSPAGKPDYRWAKRVALASV